MTSRPAQPPALRIPPGATAVLTVLGALALTGCDREPPPGADQPPEAPSAHRQIGTPTVPSELAARPPAPSPPTGSAAPQATASVAAEAPPAESSAPAAEVAPYAGPWFVVSDASAGVFAEPSMGKKGKLGYLRSGSRVAVEAGTAGKSDACKKGWLKLRDGGFVCSEAGTTNMNSPEARFTVRQPDWTKVLPYVYARNAKNGTPLYKSVPTVEQMNEYEPYLAEAKKKAQDERAARSAAAPTPPPAGAEPAALTLAPAQPRGVASPESPPDAPDGGAPDTRPWWRREDADKRLHEVKLGELESDADGLLAKRMVKGFYVAVDREFNWNGRPWYKTTKGLVAPADRFWTTQGSDFKGSELGETLTLPVGFTYGQKKPRPKYSLDAATHKLTPAGTVEYHAMVPLTGKETEIGGKTYLETKDGAWMLASHLRVPHPSPPPADLGPTERWVDVDLTSQTLVAFEGARPVYATLISSGKESKIKDKDHRTPTGEWRIREKHVTTTMDGDGSAAGDLPYSIEDVPYVMYFHRAYALHGAFWHANYGSQMSHGCVNLAPLDAKWVFSFTEPHLPEGWHGVWSSEGRPGSRVIVHE